MIKRRADLSLSAIRKLVSYEAMVDEKIYDMTPDSCLKLLKYFCEERNAAVHGPMIEDAKYKLRESYYIRNVSADISVLMRTIKRRFGGKLPREYAGCKAYYKKQMTYFKGLHRVKGKRVSTNSIEPGKLSYNLEGKYNGLPWIRQCLDKAMTFTPNTPASTK